MQLAWFLHNYGFCKLLSFSVVCSRWVGFFLLCFMDFPVTASMSAYLKNILNMLSIIFEESCMRVNDLSASASICLFYKIQRYINSIYYY